MRRRRSGASGGATAQLPAAVLALALKVTGRMAAVQMAVIVVCRRLCLLAAATLRATLSRLQRTRLQLQLSLQSIAGQKAAAANAAVALGAPAQAVIPTTTTTQRAAATAFRRRWRSRARRAACPSLCPSAQTLFRCLTAAAWGCRRWKRRLPLQLLRVPVAVCRLVRVLQRINTPVQAERWARELLDEQAAGGSAAEEGRRSMIALAAGRAAPAVVAAVLHSPLAVA